MHVASLFRNFIRQLLSSVVRHGLGLVEPQAICRVVLSRLEEVFMHCKSSDVHFILYIDDKATNSHGLLKLLEAKHKILTQHVTIQVVDNLGTLTIFDFRRSESLSNR